MRDQVGHPKLVEAIHLASIADFDLGLLRIRPSLRRIGVGAREESVEPRVMQALVALAEAGEAVVSRDALIDRCWGGRIVGEDAINRCIAKVRRLADTTEPPAFMIETVSKVGYRLKVLEGPGHVPEAIVPAQPAPAPLPPRRLLLWAAVAGAVLAGAASLVGRLQPATHYAVQASHPLLPSLESQANPRISPNGSMLAFVAAPNGGNGRIYVKALQGGTPVPVSSPEEDADAPAWSSDSVRLAYVSVGAKDGQCRIMVTTVPGGTPAIAGRCGHAHSQALAWQPDTPYLFLTDASPQSDPIFRLNIETGRSDQVTSPLRDESDVQPRLSPDGHVLAYFRSRGLKGQKLRLRVIGTGEERELDNDPDAQCFDWASDSRSLIVTILENLGDQILAYPVDGSPAYGIYASPFNLLSLATGPNGLLAMEVGSERQQLARASLTPRATADIVDPAPGQTQWPAFSPDGTLAFISDRSGHVALWIRKPGQPPTELVDLNRKRAERAVWSPDGSRIAFTQGWKDDLSVHVVTARGEKIAAFPVPSIGYGLPNWTPDGEHIVVFDKRILQAVRIDVNNPDHRVAIEDKMWDGIIYHNGAIYAHHGFDPGLWQLHAGPGGTPRLITADYPAERRPRIAFVGDDVLLPDAAGIRILAQPLKGGPSRAAYYAPTATPETPFAVDPRTGDVLYVTEADKQSHIDLLALEKR